MVGSQAVVAVGDFGFHFSCPFMTKTKTNSILSADHCPRTIVLPVPVPDCQFVGLKACHYVAM